MAGWKYSDWESQPTAAAQRARLVLHVQEVADQQQSYMTLRGLHTESEKFQIQQYYASIREKLNEFNDALGLSPGSGIPAFVEVVPHLEDSGPTWPDYQNR